MTVGTHFNNADHWRVISASSVLHQRIIATLMTTDGTIRNLSQLPFRTITGSVVPFTIDIDPHVPFQAELPIDDFELESPHGPAVKLSSLMGTGNRLEIELQCGHVPIGRSPQDPWRGSLSSGWLTL